MVPFDVIPRVLGDAARLVTKGELIVSGAAALAWWVEGGPDVSRVDLCVSPFEAAQQVDKLMGLDGWYDRQFGWHVSVASPATFMAPSGWATRALRVRPPDVPRVEIVVPHPHDIVLARVERYDAQDQSQIRQCLQAMPLTSAGLDELVATMPPRAPGGDGEAEAHRQRFAFNVTRLRALLDTL